MRGLVMSVKNDARGNVGNFGGGRENRGQSSQLQGVKKSSSTDGDLYFQSGGRTNLSKWKERMHETALLEFGGDLGDILYTEQYVTYSEPEYPEDGSRQDEALYGALVKDWMNQIVRKRDNMPKLWAQLWGNMSQESKNRVESYDGYNRLNRNPLELWRVIKATHSGGGGGDADENMRIAETNYNNMRQFDEEEIVAFKRRFDDCVDAVVAVGVPRYDEGKLARDFLGKLLNSKFSGFKEMLTNMVICGVGSRPQTLQTMFEMAANWYRSNPQRARATPTATVFAANDNRNNDSRGGKKGDDVDHPREFYFHPGTNRARMPSKYSPCGICKSPNHWHKQCDNSGPGKGGDSTTGNTDKVMTFVDREAMSDSLFAVTNQDVNAGVTIAAQEVILLDTQATNHLFRDQSLLEDIRPVKTRLFEGVGGSLTVTQAGNHPCFGRVFLHAGAPANILSFARVEDTCHIEFIGGVFYVTTQDMQTYSFERMGNMYVCNIKKEEVCVTVAQEEARYTLRDVQKAKQAKEVIRRLGHPSVVDTIQKINSGAINNCPVTVEDVKRAIDIYGVELAHLKGRTTKAKSVPVSREQPGLTVKDRQSLHVDIMFIGREA